MSGKRVVTRDELKREAINLRVEHGVRALEISKLFSKKYNVYHSPWVIGLWLRQAKVKHLIRTRALDLSTEQEPYEIAKILKLSERRVRTILQNIKGPAWDRRSTDGLVDLFLSDPSRYMTARFTQSESFGRRLLLRCIDEVNENPIAGLRVVEPSVALLDRIKRTRRKESTRRKALCLYVQSQGIEAHVYKVTNRHEIALKKLQDAFSEADGCISCEADGLRRLGTLFGSWKRWDEAYAALEGAEERYETLGHSGHDLRGNGLANCLLLRCKLHFFTVSPEAGAQEARKALKLLTGRESTMLSVSLVFALAKCLQPSKDPKEIDESQKLLNWCFDSTNISGSRSVFRAMLYWLKGHLLVSKNRRDEAIECLTLALEDAQACNDEQDVGAILADLGTLNPDSREIRSRIEDFCDWDDNGKLIFPPWCKKLEDNIRFVYDLSCSTRGHIEISVFSALREAAGGDKRMPSFITPTPPTTSQHLAV